MLVVDASVALRLIATEGGFKLLSSRDELVAPPLLWSECRSVLHEMVWRRELHKPHAEQMLKRLDGGSLTKRSPRQLGSKAWKIATDLGWAKTYDAEYIALAELCDCRLLTVDARLLRGTKRLGFVIDPSSLGRKQS